MKTFHATPRKLHSKNDQQPMQRTASAKTIHVSNPATLTPLGVLQMQHAYGNRATQRYLTQFKTATQDRATSQQPIQRVQLPGLDVHPDDLEETQRQVGLQLDAINNMNQREWLGNVLVNRYKTLDQQVSSNSATVGGAKLGAKIDQVLQDPKRNEVGVVMLEEVKKQATLALKKGYDRSLDEEYKKLIHIVEVSLQQPHAFAVFQELGGTKLMEAFNLAGVSGGMGRKKGKGDNRSFRADYEQEIDNYVIPQDPETLGKNAILHNPDQCAGGPMEILWQKEDRAELTKLENEIELQQRNIKQAIFLQQSYFKTPVDQDPEINNKAIQEQEELQELAESNLAIAKQAYAQALSKHVGNYGINSFLGESWMESFSGGQNINRVDMMLDQVLETDPAAWGMESMSVSMDVTANPSAKKNLSPPDKPKRKAESSESNVLDNSKKIKKIEKQHKTQPEKKKASTSEKKPRKKNSVKLKEAQEKLKKQGTQQRLDKFFQ